MSSEKIVASCKRFGHLRLDDALGQTLGDRRLADAGVADVTADCSWNGGTGSGSSD